MVNLEAAVGDGFFHLTDGLRLQSNTRWLNRRRRR